MKAEIGTARNTPAKPPITEPQKSREKTTAKLLSPVRSPTILGVM